MPDPQNAARSRDEALYDAGEYLVAGPANQAEWWEHLGDAHRDYAALARVAVAQDVENARLREALRKIMEGSEEVRHEGLVEATKLVLVEKNSTPTIRVKDLEHLASCGIFFGSVSCNCGALISAVKEHPGGSA